MVFRNLQIEIDKLLKRTGGMYIVVLITRDYRKPVGRYRFDLYKKFP